MNIEGRPPGKRVAAALVAGFLTLTLGTTAVVLLGIAGVTTFGGPSPATPGQVPVLLFFGVGLLVVVVANLGTPTLAVALMAVVKTLVDLRNAVAERANADTVVEDDSNTSGPS